MTPLKIWLLGPPRVELRGAGIEFETRKAVALLAYLAVTRQAHSREALTALLWPESDQVHGRAALRSTLWALHKALGETWLEVGRETVSVQAEAGLWLDVDHFRLQLAQCRSHHHPADEVCSACLPLLEEAEALYHADFLSGFTLRDCPGFDEWCFFHTETLRRELAQALGRLVTGHCARRNYDAAITHARRWLALDPLHEPAHRHLMRAYTWAGQRADALRQYAELERLFKDELEASTQVETIALVEAIKADRLPPPQPISGELARPAIGNLAAHLPLTPFVGREAELDGVARRLKKTDCRWLTIVGLGGSGKSRLALQAAIEQGAAFAHGAYFVALAPVASTELLVPAIAEALALSFIGRDDPKLQLFNSLRQKELLLVLDNFEHLREGASLVSDILRNAAGVKVLLTSQERLGAPEEWTLDLAGLRYPDAEADDDFESYSAVQLFMHSARRVHWNFAPTEMERRSIARVCRLVEGMPLAVELAAAWVRVIACEEIAQEIGHGLDVLGTTLPGLPERHRSLRVVFDHSWQRLTEAEQAVFRKLSVFRGGCTRTAAEQVAGASLSMLAALADSSCLRRTATGCYAIHELLRQYAEGKLREAAGEYEAAHHRHSGFYSNFLQQQESLLKGQGQPEAVAAIVAEIENVRAGWRWAIAHKDHAAIGRALESLRLFYDLRGWFHEGEAAFAHATEVLQVTGNEAADHLRQVTHHRAMTRHGTFLHRLGQQPRDRELLEWSYAFFRQSSEPYELAYVLHCLGVVAYARGEYAEARRLLVEALEGWRQIEDEWAIGYTLMSLGNIARDIGEYVEAQKTHTESLASFTARGHPRGIALALSNLGTLASDRGDYAEAKRLYLESLTIKRQLGDQYGIASSLNNLGYVIACLGEYAEAKRLHRDSLAIKREIGDQRGVAYSLSNLGDVAERVGDPEEARQLFHDSLRLRRQIGDRWGAAYSLNRLGAVAEVLGDGEAAREYFHEALRGALEIKAAPICLDALVGLAGLLIKDENRAQATELLSFVRRHPAIGNQTREQVDTLLAEIELNLPTEALVAARRRGESATLEEIAAKSAGNRLS